MVQKELYLGSGSIDTVEKKKETHMKQQNNAASKITEGQLTDNRAREKRSAYTSRKPVGRHVAVSNIV